MLLTVNGGNGSNAAKADSGKASIPTSAGCEAEFVALCDALHRRTDIDAIQRSRSALLAALGGDMRKLIDAVCVIAFFNGLADRIADATGLQVEAERVQMSLAVADEHLLSSSTSPLTQGGRYIITVAGFQACPYHRRAMSTASDMVTMGDGHAVQDLTFETRDEFQAWLQGPNGRSYLGSGKALRHTSSPLVYMTAVNHKKPIYIGGCDDLVVMASLMRSRKPPSSTVSKL